MKRTPVYHPKYGVNKVYCHLNFSCSNTHEDSMKYSLSLYSEDELETIKQVALEHENYEMVADIQKELEQRKLSSL